MENTGNNKFTRRVLRLNVGFYKGFMSRIIITIFHQIYVALYGGRRAILYNKTKAQQFPAAEVLIQTKRLHFELTDFNKDSFI